MLGRKGVFGTVNVDGSDRRVELLLLADHDFVDGRSSPPLAAEVLLAYREARDAKEVRDVADYQGTEPNVGHEGHSKGDEDHDTDVVLIVLDQRGPMGNATVRKSHPCSETKLTGSAV